MSGLSTKPATTGPQLLVDDLGIADLRLETWSDPHRAPHPAVGIPACSSASRSPFGVVTHFCDVSLLPVTIVEATRLLDSGLCDPYDSGLRSYSSGSGRQTM